ncbi:hypothetical protein EAF00_010735 [Botryotinia globosa]|nr:hypothetical protein EAF00_010735 [Botryotinia globosa]
MNLLLCTHSLDASVTRSRDNEDKSRAEKPRGRDSPSNTRLGINSDQFNGKLSLILPAGRINHGIGAMANCFGVEVFGVVDRAMAMILLVEENDE